MVALKDGLFSCPKQKDLESVISIVGGLLIVAASFSLLKIREFKSIDMLPALLVPLLFFIGLAIF